MHIEVSIADQRLYLLDVSGAVALQYPVSTALNGAGELKDSGRTPRGRHIIRAKIGADLPVNSVLVGRRATGEIWTPQLAVRYPQRDWILTRILWLSGCEPGFNRLGRVDTMQRYIYIHGTPDDQPVGVPDSHGCVRMCNQDVMDLFERVAVGTTVNISETPLAVARDA